ncbi:MAG TPA: pirin family protein, partial [Halieaceae bacterium]|nr:pirin family protein [Halieaceae bacterium]
MNTVSPFAENLASDSAPNVVITAPQAGDALEIGAGFVAQSFRERNFAGAMDPLVMVDHYRMTEPTFGPHPHAGLSAVSVLFEDSDGAFHNRDSLGNDFDLLPGELYWLKAGSGA